MNYTSLVHQIIGYTNAILYDTVVSDHRSKVRGFFYWGARIIISPSNHFCCDSFGEGFYTGRRNISPNSLSLKKPYSKKSKKIVSQAICLQNVQPVRISRLSSMRPLKSRFQTKHIHPYSVPKLNPRKSYLEEQLSILIWKLNISESTFVC